MTTKRETATNSDQTTSLHLRDNVLNDQEYEDRVNMETIQVLKNMIKQIEIEDEIDLYKRGFSLLDK